MTKQQNLLITATALDATLREESGLPPGAARTRVLDVRWTLPEPDGRPAYLAGHIPGAVYVDLDTELARPGEPTDGRHPLPDAERLTAAARRWGLNRGDRVVAYDGGGNFASARLWWVLRDAGFSDVRLLDGALPAWVAAGLPLETVEVTAAEGSVSLAPGRSARLDLPTVGDFASSALLLDVRAPERYAGREEPLDPRAGHIPGAVNLPTGGNLDEQGAFRPVDQLRERFAAAGIDSATPVGAYCGSGITASHTLFALALAGLDGKLFPGSWSQWSNHPDLPAALGDTP